MAEQTLLCIGYGYTANAFAMRLKNDGWRIVGTTRSAEKASHLEAAGVDPVIWDSAGETGPLEEALSKADAVLVSVSPVDGGCPAFKAAASALTARSPGPKWTGYLSTNGVYGDHNGEWVDETSALNATSARALNRIRAEAQWAQHGVETDQPVVIFRLPGIYGPGRSAIDTVRSGNARRIVKKGQVFSRAHVNDIASVLIASLENPDAGGLFNVADDEPAPPQDVIEYACNLIGIDPPPEIPFEEAELSPMARSFYADNKRVANSRIKEDLRISLQFPSYRDGLKHILAAHTS
ncbi:MAG: SDR family oxidoreductase [Pseudomonadota bacterium]